MRGAGMHAPNDVQVEARPDPTIVEPTDAIIRVSAALRGLPERERTQSVLPLLNAYRTPTAPAGGAIAPSARFQGAVCAVKDVVGQGVPQINPNLIEKYIRDLKQLRLI